MNTAPKLGDTQYDNINPLDLTGLLYAVMDYGPMHFMVWRPVYALADRVALPLLGDAERIPKTLAEPWWNL